MIIKEIDGNILEEFEKEHVDIIIQGCNCFHIMGAGLAGQLAWRYPLVYEKDKETPCGDMSKLGTYSTVKINPHQFIINAYTQFKPGANFEYLALIEILQTLNSTFAGTGYIFGFPEIGCGIGGGDWEYVKTIINEHTPDLKILVVHYDNGVKTVGTTKENIYDSGNEKMGSKQTNLFSKSEG